MERNSLLRCMICGNPLPPRRSRRGRRKDIPVCGRRSCYRAYHAMRGLSVRLQQLELELSAAICECGSEVFAWTMNGVFCISCGLEEPAYSLEPWVPAEFVRRPECLCPRCRVLPAWVAYMSV